MANEAHLARLKQGVAAWNQWREVNRDIQPDLTGADLSEADFRRAILHGAFLNEVNLSEADLAGANLTEALLNRADLTGAHLREADLSGADLPAANLVQADLSGADLHGAHLEGACLVQTTFEGANLIGCQVYGISAWNVNLVGAQQSDLVITTDDEPVITVDNLEVAQFIYLLLHNEKIREVIDTITSKAVLILGRFTPARKVVLA